MTDYVEASVLPLLKPPESSWQPSQLLPDASLGTDEFLHKVRELRVRAACLPDDYLVVLVGDMITEEALPTYMHALNLFQGVRDETGADDTPWARWSRYDGSAV